MVWQALMKTLKVKMDRRFDRMSWFESVYCLYTTVSFPFTGFKYRYPTDPGEFSISFILYALNGIGIQNRLNYIVASKIPMGKQTKKHPSSGVSMQLRSESRQPPAECREIKNQGRLIACDDAKQPPEMLCVVKEHPFRVLSKTDSTPIRRLCYPRQD
jgi:hypothetical protein